MFEQIDRESEHQALEKAQQDDYFFCTRQCHVSRRRR